MWKYDKAVIQNDLEFLQHHGILGMKWGIRRYQNEDGSLTPAGRKRYLKGIEKAQKQDNKLANKGIRDIKYRNGFTLKAGTKIYRTTVNKDETVDGTKYVSFIDVDRDHYKGGWIRETGKSDKAYEKTYTLNEDLKVPSRAEYAKTITEILAKDKNGVEKVVRARLDAFMPEGSWERDVRSIGFDEKIGDFDRSPKFWEKFVNDEIQRYKDKPLNEVWFAASEGLGLNTELKSKLVEALRSKGYNAMMDEASVGGIGAHLKEGIAPLIIFDGKKSLGEVETKEISLKEETESAKKFGKWADKVRSKSGQWGEVLD